MSSQIPLDQDGAIFLDEFSLDGSVRHVEGILPMTYVAKETGYKSILVPKAAAPEAAQRAGLTSAG